MTISPFIHFGTKTRYVPSLFAPFYHSIIGLRHAKSKSIIFIFYQKS